MMFLLVLGAFVVGVVVGVWMALLVAAEKG